MDIAKLNLKLVAVDNITLPSFKGSTFRGALGNILKDMVCLRRDRNCIKCAIKGKCAYTFIFESGVYFSEGEKKPFSGVPQPYVLEPPLNEKETYKKGEVIDLGLTLIGDGMNYSPYFTAAFDRLGKKGLGRERGRFILQNVEDVFARETIYLEEKGCISASIKSRDMAFYENIADAAGEVNACRVSLITPLRVKQKGSYSDVLDFEILMRAVLRRLTYVGQYYCGGIPDINFKELIAAAGEIESRNINLHWQDWERYSRRQNMRMKLGGLAGEIEFTGELTPFYPFLLIGQELHIGKNTTFGLGKYLVQPVRNCAPIRGLK